MTECIAMAVGVILGAGIMSYKFRVMNPAERDVMMPSQSLRDSSPEGRAKAEGEARGAVADAEGAENTAEREKMQKQWENFLNYSGNSDGQVKIES